MDNKYGPEVADWWLAHGRAAGERAIEPLISFLRGSDKELRRTAVIALGQYGDARVVEALSQAASRDWDAEVRRGAVESLGRIGGPSVVPALLNSLTDRAEAVRDTAMGGLERVDEPAVPALLDALNRQSLPAAIRLAAAVALGRIADERAITPLIKALRVPSGEYEIRRAAATALGNIAAHRPSPELRDALPVLRAITAYGGGLYRRVILEIETATAGVRHLPLPAARPIPATDDLPMPAQSPPPSPDGLPIPAASAEGTGTGADGAPARRRGVAVSRFLRRWLMARRSVIRPGPEGPGYVQKKPHE